MKMLKRSAAALFLVMLVFPIAALAGGRVKSNLPLCSQEKEDLLFSREEEKVARDVYISLYQKWGKKIFLNISESENTHMSVVLNLIEKYELTDPVGDAPVGVFDNPFLGEAYGDLVIAGSQSPMDAYLVGVFIEEMDILHLQHHIDHTTHSDVRIVYENIMRGSRNHLRSFWDHLDPEVAAAYEPEFLPIEEIMAIVNSPKETGRGR